MSFYDLIGLLEETFRLSGNNDMDIFPKILFRT